MLSEAQRFWEAIVGKVRQTAQEISKNAFRCERYEVTTAPDGSKIGVTLPMGSKEIFLPYSTEVSGATVGTPVLVVWWGSMSNAKVYYYADGYRGADTDNLLDLVYPVGSIYISVNSTEPGELFGGNWTPIEDTFLLAAGSTYAAGATGGEASHALTENQLPSISGNFDIIRAGNSTSNTTVVRATAGKFTVTRNASAATSISVSAQTPTVTSYKPDRVAFAFGSGDAHNNMPPYLSVYVWKRLPDENT